MEANTKPERIDRCLGRLPDRTWHGQEVFLCFVNELRLRHLQGEGRRQVLDTLYADLRGSSDQAALGSPILPLASTEATGSLQPQARHIIRIFYSHTTNPRDQGMVQELLNQMALLRAKGCIDEWHQGMLLGGTSLNEREKYFGAADIVLLMLSPDYVSNPALLKESERALSSRARVIPVLLRPVSDWQGLEMGQRMHLPRNGVPISKWPDRDAAFAEIAHELREVVESLL